MVVGVVVVLAQRGRVAPKIHVSYGPRMTIDLVGQRIGILSALPSWRASCAHGRSV